MFRNLKPQRECFFRDVGAGMEAELPQRRQHVRPLVVAHELLRPRLEPFVMPVVAQNGHDFCCECLRRRRRDH